MRTGVGAILAVLLTALAGCASNAPTEPPGPEAKPGSLPHSVMHGNETLTLTYPEWLYMRTQEHHAEVPTNCIDFQVRGWTWMSNQSKGFVRFEWDVAVPPVPELRVGLDRYSSTVPGVIYIRNTATGPSPLTLEIPPDRAGPGGKIQVWAVPEIGSAYQLSIRAYYNIPMDGGPLSPSNTYCHMS